MDKLEEKKAEGRRIWLFCMRNGAKLMVEIPRGNDGDYRDMSKASWSLADFWVQVMKRGWTWVQERMIDGGAVMIQLSEVAYVLEIDENDVLMMLGAGSKAFNKPSLVTPGKRTH